LVVAGFLSHSGQNRANILVHLKCLLHALEGKRLKALFLINVQNYPNSVVFCRVANSDILISFKVGSNVANVLLRDAHQLLLSNVDFRLLFKEISIM